MPIFLVDDEPCLGRMLCQSLAEHGYGVVLATSYAGASDRLADGHADVIVLDLTLPDGDGLTLIRAWRASGFTEPVIVLSARASADERTIGLNAFGGTPHGTVNLPERVTPGRQAR